MIVFKKDFGSADHLQMELSLDTAEEVPKCGEPSDF
jgi:hypothetical protein